MRHSGQPPCQAHTSGSTSRSDRPDRRVQPAPRRQPVTPGKPPRSGRTADREHGGVWACTTTPEQMWTSARRREGQYCTIRATSRRIPLPEPGRSRPRGQAWPGLERNNRWRGPVGTEVHRLISASGPSLEAASAKAGIAAVPLRQEATSGSTSIIIVLTDSFPASAKHVSQPGNAGIVACHTSPPFRAAARQGAPRSVWI